MDGTAWQLHLSITHGVLEVKPVLRLSVGVRGASSVYGAGTIADCRRGTAKVVEVWKLNTEQALIRPILPGTLPIKPTRCRPYHAVPKGDDANRSTQGKRQTRVAKVCPVGQIGKPVRRNDAARSDDLKPNFPLDRFRTRTIQTAGCAGAVTIVKSHRPDLRLNTASPTSARTSLAQKWRRPHALLSSGSVRSALSRVKPKRRAGITARQPFSTFVFSDIAVDNPVAVSHDGAVRRWSTDMVARSLPHSAKASTAHRAACRRRCRAVHGKPIDDSSRHRRHVGGTTVNA